MSNYSVKHDGRKIPLINVRKQMEILLGRHLSDRQYSQLMDIAILACARDNLDTLTHDALDKAIKVMYPSGGIGAGRLAMLRALSDVCITGNQFHIY